MRSILCPADSADTLDDRVETALALARTTRGHVTFQIATPFAQMAIWEPFGGAAMSAQVINDVRAADEQLGIDLDKRLAPQDVAYDVVLIDQGRLHHQGATDDPDTHRALEAVFDHRVAVRAVDSNWVVLPAQRAR